MSLALPLFVSVNKFLGQQAYFAGSSAHAKALTELFKKDHPRIIRPGVASPEHVLAITAFALGYGLTQWTQQGQDPLAIRALGSALSDVLAKCDASLDASSADHMHMVLIAHEAYKAHQHRQQVHAPIVAGMVRGVMDALPLATVEAPPEDAQTEDLPIWSPRAKSATPDLDDADFELDLGWEAQDATSEMPLRASPLEDFSLPTDYESATEELHASQADETIDQHSSELTDFDAAEPAPLPADPLPALDRIALDRAADRGLPKSHDALQPEDMDALRRRQERQERNLKEQSAPLSSVVLPFPAKHIPRKAPPRPEDGSEWRSNLDASTHLHTESAADEKVAAKLPPARKSNLPLQAVGFFLCPPWALFAAGRAFERKEAAGCALALACCALGTIAWTIGVNLVAA